MAVTNEQVAAYLASNPGLSDAQIAQTMAQFNVTPAQMAAVTGIPESQVAARVAAAPPVYFEQNPDVAAAYQQNSYGLTPAQFAQTHYERFGQFEQRAPVGMMSAPVAASTPAAAVAATTPVVATTAATTGATAEPWDYDKYYSSLRSKDTDFFAELGKLGGIGATNAQNIYREILAQQNAGSSEFWYAGNAASKEAAAADFALRLAENGIGSLSQLGQTTIPGSFDAEGGYSGGQQVTINKATGQPIPRPELLGRGNRDLDIDYNLTFTDNGQVIPYTSNRKSSWMSFRENALKPAASFALAYFGAPMIGAAVAPAATAATQAAIGGAIAGGGSAALTGGDVLQGAVLGGVGGYLRGANIGANTIPGLGPQTDASFLAADAAQLASQGLSESAISQVLGASGYGSTAAANLAASMAVNGLDVGTMTQQLDALSTNTGLMSQTGSSADFLAADALQLQGQLGNNFPAIEQNLIASGVDPLIAADVSQQLAFNPGLTQTQLAGNLSTSFGNNIYDVNMAQTYPTSVLPGAGGLLSDAAAAGNTAATTTTAPATTTPAASTGLTNTQISNLIRAGVGLLGTGAAVGAVGGGNNTTLQAPTQGVPTNTPEYYQQLQQYYNAYLPQTPRDVVTPLQQWYNSSYGA